MVPLDSGECLVRLPFWDGEGDPVELTVAISSGQATIDDAGSVAGLLFSLGQDDQATPAFKLLDDLQRTHRFEIDFDDGLIRVSVPENHLYDGIAEMAKVVLAMHTVVPHIRVSPRRVGSYGPRLRSKITRRYRQLKILDMVERSYPLAGATHTDWPVGIPLVGREQNREIRSCRHLSGMDWPRANLLSRTLAQRTHKIARQGQSILTRKSIYLEDTAPKGYYRVGVSSLP